MGEWGPWQIIIVLLVVLLLFGGSRLPGLARSLGSSLTEFKKGLRGEDSEHDRKKIDASREASPPPSAGEKEKAAEHRDA